MNTPDKKTSKVGTAVWAVVALFIVALAVVAVPNFIKSRSTSCCNACVNNLRQIDAAANQFALEQHKTNGEAIPFPTT